MLRRSNTLEAQIKDKQDILLSKINQVKTSKVKKDENSKIRLPKIKNIKYFIQQTELTSLNNNNETTISSNHLKSNFSNRIYIPVLKNEIKKVGVQTEKTNKILPLKKKLKSLNNLGLKKSPSANILIPKHIPSVAEFHKKIMEENQLSCSKRLKEELKNYKNNAREKERINEMVFGKRSNKKVNTGIYGPSNNIVSVIMARIQRLKLDNDYRGVDEDLKELIKDEILDAQVKLKRKPFSLGKKKDEKNPLFQTKLDKYRYLTKMNLIREINQNAATPLIVKDGNMMIKLINEAFDNFKIKYKV